MLGVLRFVLAMLVVVAHLTEGKPAFFLHWGVFAVFGFYLVSGYLMTVILHQTYSFNLSSFVLNRFLRIYPAYFLVAAATVLVLQLAPATPEFHPAWEVNRRFTDYAGNILIFPFEFYGSPFRLVPPSWSLAVELVNYLLLWLMVARNRFTATAVVIAAVGYHIFTIRAGWGWETRYRPFYAALLPFALGACVYFVRDYLATLSRRAIAWTGFVALAIWLANLLICGAFSRLGGDYFELFFYINLVTMLAVVACITGPAPQTIYRRTGKLLGDLSYPVFLTHFMIAFIVSAVVLDGQKRGLVLFMISLPPILVISYGLSRLENAWLTPLRAIVRQRATERRDTSDSSVAVTPMILPKP